MNPNRPTRRISRLSRDNGFTCSQQSVFNAMDRFVKAVNNMHSTVLVPSRLQDIDVSNENNELSRCLPANLDSTDVYRFFTMFKDVQNELLWGPTVESRTPSRYSSGRSSPSNPGVMKYVREFSDNRFPRDRKSDSDDESVFTDQDSGDEQTPGSLGNNIASAFRYHLLGLHTILHELTKSADYLSSRYQEEIEPSSV